MTLGSAHTNAISNTFYHAEEGEIELISDQIHIPYLSEPHQSFEMGKGTFSLCTDSTFYLVPFFLTGGEIGATTSSLVKNTIVDVVAPASSFVVIIGIGFVTEDGAFIA